MLDDGPMLRAWRFVALLVWVAGVQLHEALGTAGLALLTASFAPSLIKHLARKRAAAVGQAVWGWWPLLAFVAWALLAPMSAGEAPSGAGVARTLDWASVPLVATAASSLTPRQWKALALAAVGTLAASGLVAGLQHFGVWPPVEAFASLEWTRIPFARVYEPVPNTGGRFMGGGLLFHRLKFGHVSGVAVVAAVVAARRLTGRVRVAVIACGAFGFVAVWLFPYARMAAVAMSLAAGLTLVLVSRSPRRALLVAAALGVVGLGAALGVSTLRARFASALTDEGSGQRSFHLAAGVEAVRQHPIAGVGPGQFRPSKFGGPDMPAHVRDNPGKAHNQFLSMAAETGVVGALLFVGALGWLVLRARQRPLGALTLGALAVLALLSLAHDPLFQAPFSLALVLAVGLGLAQGPDATCAPPGQATAPTPGDAPP